jgi:hypothetical protein
MSESPAERAQVEPEAGAPPEPDEAQAEEPPPKSLDEVIAELQEESSEAAQEKEAADSHFADVSGRLAAVLGLQRDLQKATDTYAAMYPQLQADHSADQDYYETETETLTKVLGTATDQVAVLVEEARKALEDASTAVEDRTEELATAVAELDAAETTRKAKENTLKDYRQLGVTIGNRHKALKTQRDAVTKARQDEQWAVAYWLLTFRGYPELLDAPPPIIAPDDLPAALLDAVTELADAEQALAAKEAVVTRRRQALADAERRLADQKARGEADLRQKLAQLEPAED